MNLLKIDGKIIETTYQFEYKRYLYQGIEFDIVSITHDIDNDRMLYRGEKAWSPSY